MTNFALPGLLDAGTPESDRLDPILKLLPYVYGSMWDGINTVGPVTFFGEVPATEAQAAKLLFFADDMKIVCELNTPTEIEITDPFLWVFNVPPMVLPVDLTPGLWNWEFQVQTLDIYTRVYTGVFCVQHPPVYEESTEP